MSTLFLKKYDVKFDPKFSRIFYCIPVRIVYNRSMKGVCGMVVFGIVIALWLLIGFLAMLTAKAHSTNWFIIIFMGFAPFIPVIAKVCGML